MVQSAIHPVSHRTNEAITLWLRYKGPFSVPGECMNGYGVPQLLNAAALQDPLEKPANQHYAHGLDLHSSGD
jgi:hypothetical protein